MDTFGTYLHNQLATAQPAQKQLLQRLGAATENIVAKTQQIQDQIDAARFLTSTSLQAAGLAAAATVGCGALVTYESIRHTYQKLKQTFFPYKQLAQPCLPCLGLDSAAMRQMRTEKRQALLQEAKKYNHDAASTTAAQSLAEDMHAVELARLSDNSYTQFDQGKTEKEKRHQHLGEP